MSGFARMGLSVVALAVVMATAGTAVAGDKMSMADLTALGDSGDHDELLSHAKDIPPGKRDAKWKALVEKAAIAELESIDVASEPWRAASEPEGLAKQFPHLRSSRAFMDKRAEVGLKSFPACYKRSWSGASCNDRLIALLKGDKGNVKLAVQAGDIMIREQFAYIAVRAYRVAVLDFNGAKSACSEGELQRSVTAAFEANLPEDNPIMKDAKKMKAACDAAKK
jgi:hypothetical protein